MLPLHDTRRAFRICGVRDGAVVGFLVEAVGGKGVGDSRARGLDQGVVLGVIKVLEMMLATRLDLGVGLVMVVRTGPVRTLPDLVLHVPTMSEGRDCAAALVSSERPAARVV